MSETDRKPASRLAFIALGLGLLLLGGVAGWLWESQRTGPADGMAARDRAAIEQVVRDYILANPEILPEAMENLQQKANQKQLAEVGDDLEKPFPGAVMGNPDGKVVLVSFSDFGCTYCRQSVADVDALIRDNADLKVVLRELPILSPASGEAAKWGLAAAEQGRYAQFHRAMFAAGRPDAATIEAAAKVAGLDMERARRVIAEPRVTAELDRNIELARQLGFNGTPSWAVGDQLFSGAVGREALQKAIDVARDAA